MTGLSGGGLTQVENLNDTLKCFTMLLDTQTRRDADVVPREDVVLSGMFLKVCEAFLTPRQVVRVGGMLQNPTETEEEVSQTLQQQHTLSTDASVPDATTVGAHLLHVGLIFPSYTEALAYIHQSTKPLGVQYIVDSSWRINSKTQRGGATLRCNHYRKPVSDAPSSGSSRSSRDYRPKKARIARCGCTSYIRLFTDPNAAEQPVMISSMDLDHTGHTPHIPVQVCPKDE